MNYVELTEHEVGVCQDLAAQREQWCQENNARNYKADVASDYDIAAIGVSGEYVVMKALGVGGFGAIHVSGPNPAGDVLLPNGEMIEVKTTKRPRLNFLIEAQDGGKFDAAYGALVWKMGAPRLFALAGWCTNEEFQARKRWEENMPKPAWLLDWQFFHSCQHWPFPQDYELNN